ncbi:30S ribosome binding factor [Gammaproteobacteria bacterium]
MWLLLLRIEENSTNLSMPKEFSRSLRLGDQIQRELAELLEREVKDPQIGMVTITAVKVTRDLAHAKVYITVLGDADAVRVSLQALQRAGGFLRSALAGRLRVRTVPSLHFVYDASVERGIRIGALIAAAVASDRRFHDGEESSSSQPAFSEEDETSDDDNASRNPHS